MTHVEPDDDDLDDDRETGNWRTRYETKAWIQIIAELIYLCLLLLLCISLLIDAASINREVCSSNNLIYSNITGMKFTSEVSKWIALAIAGMIGGIVFALKWLYHSVAKNKWNQDRVLWRLIVPWNSAMVSMFTGFIFASGIIPFLKNEDFNQIYTLLGTGFIFGYFSDNILASLQNLAHKIFGTLDSGD